MKIRRAISKTGVVHALQPNGSYIKAVPNRDRVVKSFDAAGINRLTGDWTAHSRLSADGELQGKLPIIRSRSREHENDDPYAANYLRLAENNVIGHSGISLQMKVIASETEDDATGEILKTLDHPANREIERAWKRFGQRENYLVTRDRDAVAADKLILRTILRDGDVLIRKVRGYPNEFGFALQLLEPDYLDDQFVEFRGVECNCPQERGIARCQTGRHEVRMGVELHGDWKFPVAYWLLANHPGDYFYGNQYATRRIRVPVEEIIHPFVAKRIEQTRGIPAMVAAMLRLQMLGGYIEAELVAARCGAQKMGFLEKEIPDSVADQYFDPEQKSALINGAPGEIEELPMGVKFKEWDPQHPNANMPGFNKEMLRGYGAGCGVSYTALANDIENVNYSSIRAGLLEEREVWKSLQTFFISDVKREIFRPWLEQALLTGAVDLPFSRFDEFVDHDAVIFKGRRWPWVDPAKDVAAAKEAVDAGFTTLSEVISDRGLDFEEVTAERKREKELLEASGLGEPKPEPAAEEEPETVETFNPETDIVHQRWEHREQRKKELAAVKSAYIGDVAISDLPAEVRETVAAFAAAPEGARVLRYGMTVPELIDKADQHNLDTARHHLRNVGVAEASTAVRERPGKFILLINDRIIDGHHHLAKAEKGKVTSSLAVLDLTPLRYQEASSAVKAFDVSAFDHLVEQGVKGWVTINGAHVHIGEDGSASAGPARLIEHLNRRATITGQARQASDDAKPKPAAKPAKPAAPAGWIDAAPGLPSDTKDHHTDPATGGYKAERRVLHESIVAKFIGGTQPVPADQRPVAILMMGGTASGKSTFVKSVDTSSFVHVDADAVKAELPEYQSAAAQRARNAAALAHEESSDLAKEIGAHAVATNRNLLFDSTGANSAKYSRMIENLKASGYHVKIIAAHIPVQEALVRAHKRAERSGRHVPESFIREAYAKIPASFAHNAQKVDEFELWDNSTREPRLVTEKRAGVVATHHPEFLSQHGFA